MNVEKQLEINLRGIAIVVKDMDTIFEFANGYSDLQNKVKNTIDTKFASASAGKVFVAVGILQLVDSKKLNLNDKLGDILRTDLGQIDPEVTVEQLLNHTSGVPDYFDESTMSEYEELWTDFPNYKIRHNSDLLPLFLNKPMMYPKGTRFQYNNSGYVLLAWIIEKITGMEFDQYLKRNVFQVCGMESTGYYELDRLPEKCADNYIFCEDTKEYRTNIFCVDAKGTGAGGAYVTGRDIICFWQNLLQYNLLSKDLTEKMLQRQSREETEDGVELYGYGVWLINNPQADIPFFQGYDPGVSFVSEYNPTKNIISVLISNYGDDVWDNMNKIRKCLY